METERVNYIKIECEVGDDRWLQDQIARSLVGDYDDPDYVVAPTAHLIEDLLEAVSEQFDMEDSEIDELDTKFRSIIKALDEQAAYLPLFAVKSYTVGHYYEEI